MIAAGSTLPWHLPEMCAKWDGLNVPHIGVYLYRHGCISLPACLPAHKRPPWHALDARLPEGFCSASLAPVIGDPLFRLPAVTTVPKACGEAWLRGTRSPVKLPHPCAVRATQLSSPRYEIDRPFLITFG
jgi:hypothetical protein